MPLDRISELRKRTREVLDTHAHLSGQREALVKRQAELLTDAEAARTNLSLRAEVDAVLERLQEDAQARSIGLFEDLLTAAVRDVLPESNGRVVFDLGVERGRPALDILMERDDGARENIVDGRGGSLVNVISTCLRFIVLNRLANRRFIVLDEVDCWLRVDKIQSFAKIISDLSRKIGVQCLVISHHDSSHFAPGGSVVTLARDEQGVYVDQATQPAEQGEFTEDEIAAGIPGLMSGVGLGHIRLINFMSHADSTLPLSPNVTTLVGPNDIGKSAVVAALRAVAYNESSASVIRHGHQEAMVEIGLEDGLTLTWRRKLRGRELVVYELTDESGELLHRESSATKVPDWVNDYLAIRPVHGIDVQIGHQKDPVFMVGPSVTRTRRAELLSLGREAQQIQQMLAAHGENLKGWREDARRSEKAAEQAREELKKLRPISELADQVPALRDGLPGIEERMRQAETLEAIVEKLDRRRKALKDQSDLLAALGDLPAEPVIEPTDQLARLCQRIDRAMTRHESLARPLPKIPEEPMIDRSEEKLSGLIARLERAHSLQQVHLDPLPEPPELVDMSKIVSIGKGIAEAARRLQESEAALAKLGDEIAQTELARDKLIEELGGDCPTCGQHMPTCEHTPKPARPAGQRSRHARQTESSYG